MQEQMARIEALKKEIETLQHQNEALLVGAQKESVVLMDTMVQKIHQDYAKKRQAFEKKLKLRTLNFEEKLEVLQQDLVRECETQSQFITESMLMKLTGTKPQAVKIKKILKSQSGDSQ